jgi:hypothetical protein
VVRRWLRGVAVFAAVILVGLLVLLAQGYGLFSGRIDPSIAGPASGWVGDALTAIGFGGIMLQLLDIRQTEDNEVTREENSLFAWAEWQPWELDGEGDGVLIRVFVRNDGTRKVMDLDVELLPATPGQQPATAPQPVKAKWRILGAKQIAIAPGTRAHLPAAVFHVPRAWHWVVFGAEHEPPRIRVSWTDARNQRLQMDDNHPSVRVVAR